MVNIPILPAARAAITAYASAISLASNPSIRYSTTAAAMADLYRANFTSFTLGTITVFPDRDFARAAIERNLVQYNASGLGTDFRYEGSRVDAVGATSAVVWITWRVVPPARREGGVAGREVKRGWAFTDVYGFRVSADGGGDGGWEWSNADDEYEKLGENWPGFFNWGRQERLSGKTGRENDEHW